MHSITMPLHAAKEMCRALLPHVSKDLFTPALTHAAIIGNFAYATDRYTIGRYDLTNIVESTTDEPVHLPRVAVHFISNLGAATLLDDMVFYSVKVEVFEDITQVLLLHNQEGKDPRLHLMRAFTTPKHVKFPPVGGLFRDIAPGEEASFAVAGEHMNKFSGYARSVRLPMRVTTTHGAGRTKLPPVLIEVGLRFKGLLQPTPTTSSDFGANIFAATPASDTDLPATGGEQPKGN